MSNHVIYTNFTDPKSNSSDSKCKFRLTKNDHEYIFKDSKISYNNTRMVSEEGFLIIFNHLHQKFGEVKVSNELLNLDKVNQIKNLLLKHQHVKTGIQDVLNSVKVRDEKKIILNVSSK